MSSFNVSNIVKFLNIYIYFFCILLCLIVPPIITITRNPDSEMVEDDTTVTVTCMITSNPQSRISWEQITTNDRTDRTDHANTPIHLTNSFNIVSMSTISFTSEDINGFSTFCCSASNDIGLTSSCLNFTETGRSNCINAFYHLLIIIIQYKV